MKLVLVFHYLCLVLLPVCSSTVSHDFLKSTDDIVNSKEVNTGKKLNILLISDYLFGHMAKLLPLGEELVHRGHNVSMLLVVYEAEQERYKSHVEKYDVHLWNVSSEDLPAINWKDLGRNVSKSFFKTNIELAQTFGMLCNIIAKHMNNSLSAGDWDLVIANEILGGLASCMLSIHKVPFVVVGHFPFSFYLYPTWSWPSLMHGAASDNMGFIDRIFNVLSFTFTKGFVYFAIFLLHKRPVATKYCPSVTLNQLTTDVGLRIPVIVPTVIGLDYPRPIYPMVDYVGAMVSKHPAPLTGDLGEWLNNKPDRSVVYISMGSLFDLNGETAKALFEGVMKTNHSLLWSLKKSNQGVLEGVDIDLERVMISDWTPQFSVLGSRAIHSAILHGGNNGINEALWNGVPIIVLPQMFEQVYNGGRVHFNGFGILLDSKLPSSEEVAESLRAIGTGGYQTNVSKVQKMNHLAGGVDRAADLVEFYEAVGYEHLIPAYIKYQWNWVQYYNADVYALLLLMSSVFVVCVLSSCRCLCRACSCMGSKEKEE